MLRCEAGTAEPRSAQGEPWRPPSRLGCARAPQDEVGRWNPGSAEISPRDPQKIARDQARAADEGAVDVLDREQLLRVRGLDRAAVEDAHAELLGLADEPAQLV